MSLGKNVVFETKREQELIKALEKGEQSGFIENFDPDVHLKSLHGQQM